MNWADCGDIWARDGSLRDIYIFNTTLEDWKKFLIFLTGRSGSVYSVDGESAPLPHNLQEQFRPDRERSYLLAFPVGRLILHCHFFSVEEIELDLDPRDIQSQDDLSQLAPFLRELAALLGKEVRLTAENDRARALFSCLPPPGSP
jgi:hypothetical protein